MAIPPTIDHGLQPAMSLEDHRRNKYLTIDEFASHVGVSLNTYYRLLEGKAQIPTMRRVADKLGVPPAGIIEFTPRPTIAYLHELNRGIEYANEHGWIIGDPETGLPTDEIVQEHHTPLKLA